MKNRSLLLVLAATGLLISACNTAQTPTTSEPDTSTSTPASTSEEPYVPCQAKPKVYMEASLNTHKLAYNLEFNYDDAYFNKSAKEYSKELSMLSYGFNLSTASVQRGQSFYETTKFEDFTAVGYEGKPTKDSIGYFMGHRRIEDSELFVVSFRGHNYGMEWSNNLLMGRTGDHEGFLLRATEAYANLKTYIETHKNGRNVKILVDGYSRGGAISNVLASLMLRDEYISQDNLFVYTFECPNCLVPEHCIAYPNVHNIVNSRDLIASIPPASFGFGRCGIDYDIYVEDFEDVLSEFDSGIEYPAFTNIPTDPEIASDLDLKNYIIAQVFENESIPEESRNTNRNEYVDHYQTGIGYGIGIFFSFSSATLTQVMADFKANALTYLSDETGVELANALKPFLDQDQIPYEDEELVANCAVVVKAAGTLLITILFMMMSDNYMADLTRVIDFHYPETVYALLQNYHSK